MYLSLESLGGGWDPVRSIEMRTHGARATKGLRALVLEGTTDGIGRTFHSAGPPSVPYRATHASMPDGLPGLRSYRCQDVHQLISDEIVEADPIVS